MENKRRLKEQEQRNGDEAMGDIMIHVPQQIHIEYTVENGRLTQRVLELLNAVMLRNEPEAQKKDSLLGLFADQAELLDLVAEAAIQSREIDSLRVIGLS